MIPVIFRTVLERETAGKGPAAEAQALKDANKEAAAVLGFTSAMAAYGAFVIPRSYGTAIALTGEPGAAIYLFLAYYITCIAATWWWYRRKNAEVRC
jgi:NNP family nitrate/nitrite transporter-like MFS transporter